MLWKMNIGYIGYNSAMNNMKYTTIIAIDPDTEKSGVALLDLKRSEVEARAMPFPELLDMLRDVSQWTSPLKVIVEGGWLVAKSNYHYARGKGGERIAKNVGANHETGRKIVEMLEYWGIQHEVVHPLKKYWRGREGKITLTELNSLLRGMGIREMGRCNQDMRDAVLIALTYSGLPMRMR